MTYLTLNDLIDTIFYFALGGIIIWITSKDMIETSPEGLFLFMSVGMGIISFGFIRFIYKFLKTKTKNEAQ